MDAILARHSVREFVGGKISDETLEKLVHAGMSAPSAMHSAPWHFVVVTDRDRLNGVSGVHPYAAMSLQASAGILVCGEPDSEILKEFFDQNCAAAVENILIAVSDLGLGAVWVGVYPNKTHCENFTKYFQLPENIAPFAWIPIGYPKNPAKQDNRLDLSRVHRNVW
ncbi:MAG: nitroreductase family protein [Puniceicoccales bacterium]|jgi:nitroreductase|nr:nitroreductase family protein [Puniceicoccales bacterium]